MNEKVRRIWPEWEIDVCSPDNGVLGSGSFGDVYRICRRLHGVTEYAALKIITIPRDARELNQLKQEYDTDEQISCHYAEIKESFEKEYATMVMLRGHANIVYCDDIRFEPHPDNLGWDIHIKMELLTPMIRNLPLKNTEELARTVGIHICRALILCHKLGIIHRDIKPQNIFLSRDGNYKLGDFGIAKHMEGTQFGTMAGTEDYMAPEVNFFQPYSFQADIYSLGLVMYWILNNYAGPFLPTDGNKPAYSQKMAARTKRLSGTPIPEPLNGSAALKRIVVKACSFDAQKRFHSADEMLRELEALGERAKKADDEKTVLERRKPTVRTADQDTPTVYTSADKAAPKDVSPLVNLLNNRLNQAGNQEKEGHSEPYAYKPAQKNAVTQTPPKKDPPQPYSYTPPKGSAVTQTASRNPKTEPYSYVPPKGSAVEQTPGRKTQSEPYSYVPPKTGAAAQTSGSKAQSETYSYVPPRTGAASRTSAEKSKSEPYSYVPPKKETATPVTKTASEPPKQTAAASGPKQTTSAYTSAAYSTTAQRVADRPKKKKKPVLMWVILLAVTAAVAYSVLTHPSVALKEQVTTTVGADALSLMEVGYIEDPDRKLVIYDSVREKYPNDSTWYTYTGEKAEHIQFQKIHYLDRGLYKGINDLEGINDLSLFTNTGEVLLYQDACMLEWAYYQDEYNPRYLLVYKAIDRTDNKAEFLINEDENYISTYHSAGTMYTGTIRVFDADLMRFVPGLPEITKREQLDICGNSIVIHNGKEGSVMYNADGLPIWESSDKPESVAYGYLVSKKDGTYYIVDDQGNVTFTSNIYMSPVQRSVPYLKVGFYEKGVTNKIIDIYGTTVLEGYFVGDYHEGIFEVHSEDYEKQGLVSADGTEILPCKYDYIEHMYKGYWVARYKNQYTMVTADGVIAKDLKEKPYYLVSESNDHLFIMNNRTYDLPTSAGGATTLTYGLVAVKSDETGFETVYDLFSGEQLLPYEYESVDYAGDYLYVYRDGGWGVFAVHFTRDGVAY